MPEHKNPADRAHMWQRDVRHDEKAVAVEDASTYPHQVPRYLHKTGEEPLYVADEKACKAALADGWALVPKAADEPEADHKGKHKK